MSRPDQRPQPRPAGPRARRILAIWLLATLATTVTGPFGSYQALDWAERAAYWEWMVRFWPDYANYQTRTEREIPIVVLDAEPC